MPTPNANTRSAVARADALLTHWEQRLRLAPQAAPPPAATPRGTGQKVLRPVARGYVWLAATAANAVIPLQQNWQQAVAEARREQQQVARRAGPSAGQRVGARERQGEGNLKEAAEAASTATEAAGSVAA